MTKEEFLKMHQLPEDWKPGPFDWAWSARAVKEGEVEDDQWIALIAYYRQAEKNIKEIRRKRIEQAPVAELSDSELEEGIRIVSDYEGRKKRVSEAEYNYRAAIEWRADRKTIALCRELKDKALRELVSPYPTGRWAEMVKEQRERRWKQEKEESGVDYLGRDGAGFGSHADD